MSAIVNVLIIDLYATYSAIGPRRGPLHLQGYKSHTWSTPQLQEPCHYIIIVIHAFIQLPTKPRESERH